MKKTNEIIIPENIFAKEIAMCRSLYKKDKKCNWGECEKCGVMPLLWKLHKGELIEGEKELKKIKNIFFESFSKKVMAFGTFDIYHAGHESYLSQAKKLGEYLIAVVARDKNVLRIKKQRTRNSEQERLKNIKLGGLADEVVLGNLKDKHKIIEKYRPDVIALGYDQKVDLVELENKLKEFKIKAKIVRLKSFKPEIYKSSKLRYGA